MPKYGEASYWDKRYQDEGADFEYDWLENYEVLKSKLSEFLTSKDNRILVLGCGNAKFSEDLYDDGYTNVINIDISPVVIAQMQARNVETRPQMEWREMDCTDMSAFESNSFDLIIDKATMDALCCSEEVLLSVAKLIKESQRILKVGCCLFSVSFSTCEKRAFLFQQPFVKMNLSAFRIIGQQEQAAMEGELQCNDHHIFTLEKLEGADEHSEENYSATYAGLVAAVAFQKFQMLTSGKQKSEENDEERLYGQHDVAAQVGLVKQVSQIQTSGAAEQSEDEEAKEEEIAAAAAH